MKNLMTQKFVFGLLMAFVLALGVQGVAAAQSVSDSGDGSTTSSSSGTVDYQTTDETDLETNPLERSFTITVKDAEDADTIKITGDPTSLKITDIEKVKNLINDGGSLTALPDNPVTITVDPPGVNLHKDDDSDQEDTFTITFVTGATEAVVGIDLNGNGNTADFIPASTGVRESAAGFDINGDGDETDKFTFGPVTILESKADSGNPEDLNGDGDTKDKFTLKFAPTVSEATATIDLNGDGDQTDYLTSVSESTAGNDLNGDGDTSDTFTKNFTAYEERQDWKSGSVTLKVKYKVYALGEYTITVSAPNIDDDIDGSPVEAYVVRSSGQTTGTSIITSGTTSTPQLITTMDSVAIAIANDAGTSWTQINLSITGGKLYRTSGNYLSNNRLYELFGKKEFTTLSMFTGTGSSVSAYVTPNAGQVAKVTATVPGSTHRAKTYTIAYFSSAVVIEPISGDNQFGTTTPGYHSSDTERESRSRKALTHPLVVRVTDGHSTNKGVRNQWVEFNLGGSNNDGDPFLRATSRTFLWDHSGDGHINRADDNRGNALAVKTDGSGYAKVYFVPGDAAASSTISYRVPVQTSPTVLDSTNAASGSPNFSATAVQAYSTHLIDPTDSITTSTPQFFSGQSSRVEDMKVKVESASTDFSGSLQTNVIVDFSATGAQISRHGSTYGSSVTTVSDSTGVATIKVKSQSSTATVTATVRGSNHNFRTYVVTYFFQSPHIEIVSGNNQFGVTGGRIEDALVVRVLDGSGGSPVANQLVMFEETTSNPTDENGNEDVYRSVVPVPGTTVLVQGTTPTSLVDEQDETGKPNLTQNPVPKAVTATNLSCTSKRGDICSNRL